MSQPSGTTACVVIVNYNGAADTVACLDAFRHVVWPSGRPEVVVVDNASSGDDVDVIRAAHPDVEVVSSPRNVGFAAGCNLGAARSSAGVLAFVNNDAKPAPGFLVEATQVLFSRGDIGAVATKVLDEAGELIDFVDAGQSWYGQAFKLHVGEPDQASLDVERDVLFGTGSALVVRKAVFDEVGGFDPAYFMFFEDVDLGWRIWLAGYRVRYAPGAVTYHKHHASMSSIGSWREQYLLERNALWTIYKNYDDENLARVLPGAIALSVRRGVELSGADPTALDLEHGNVAGEPATAEVHRSLLASTFAVDAFASSLGRLAGERARIQAGRRRPDTEILRLFRSPFQANIPQPGFTEALEGVTEAFGVRSVFSRRSKIVVATGDTVADRMAGPAIRAWHIAEALSAEHDVRLVTTSDCDLTDPRFEISHVNALDMVQMERWADVIVFQGYLMHEHPCLRHSQKVVVVDVYDPFHLEQLEQARDLGEEARRHVVASATGVLNEQLERGDFFMCASDKQRDFWLGQLAALGRVNPAVYDDDESLGSFISVVPFGVGNAPPRKTAPGMRGVIDGIGETDKIVLWGGGIYNWFDPITLIRAIDRARDRVPDIRLVFMGVKHPNPAVPEMRMAVDAERVADELGLLGTHVFFNRQWVAYKNRQNFLLEADIGVSTHLDHVETAFSFRTRILDYLWATLPIVCTQGDSLATLVHERDLGATVPPLDVDALADAMVGILTDPEAVARHKANIVQVAEAYRWELTLAPLVEFCRRPRRAADVSTGPLPEATGRVAVHEPRWGGVTGDVRLVGQYLREGGGRLLVHKMRQRSVRMLSAVSGRR